MNARRVFFAALIAGLVVVLIATPIQERVSTDVLDLLPDGEGAPELELARGFLRERSARVLLFALVSKEPEAPWDAADAFAAALRASGLFEQVANRADALDAAGWGEFVFEHRLELLFPKWLAGAEARAGDRSLSRVAAEDLKEFLLSPDYPMFQGMEADDPLLLMPSLLRQAADASLVPEGEVFSAQGPQGEGIALVWARQQPSPFLPEGQGPVFAAIERAAGELPEGVALRFTGVNRFAEASRAAIEGDVKKISGLGLLLAALIALSGLRSAKLLVHLFVPVCLAIPSAFFVGLAVFGHVHLLAIALGSILFGVALDFGLHAVLHRRGEETYGATLRRIRLPLVLGGATSLAGFLCLLWSGLPVLRQTGVFVASGLGLALVFLALYLPGVKPSMAGAPWLAATGARRWAWLVLALIGIPALAGLGRLQWKDSLRDLEVPLPGLLQEEELLQGWFGRSHDSGIALVGGEGLEDALAAAWRMNAALDGAGAFNLAMLLPDAEQVERAWRFAPEQFAGELREALEEEGFRPGAFAGFFQTLESYDPRAESRQETVREFFEKLPGPALDLWQAGAAGTWLVTTLPGERMGDAVAAGALPLDQARTLEGVMGDYRRSAVRLAMIGFAAMGIVLFVVLGWRRGVMAVGIPLAALALALGGLGWVHQALNLFHVIGFLLAFCLSVDYAVFSVWDGAGESRARLSVRLSALTTMAAFGVLGLSQVAAVRSLGAAVAFMVLFALLICEVVRGRS